MSKITEEIGIPINTTAKKEKTLLIDQKTISKINQLIKQKEEEKIIHKLEVLKKSGKKKYSQAKTIKKKQNVLEQIFSNLELLLNNTNYKKMYNSDASLGKNGKDYSSLEKITDMISVGNERNYNGANCHSWTLYIYNILKDITNNEIEYYFELNKKTNHSLLYIKLRNKIFSYEYDEIKHIFNSNPNTKYYSDYTYDNNEEDYSKNKDKKGYLRNTITYNIGKKYIKIHKKFGLLLLEVKNDEEKFKKINIPGLKFISKKIYRIFKYIKFIGFVKKSNNMFEIRDEIYSKIKNEKDKKLIEKFFYNIN